MEIDQEYTNLIMNILNSSWVFLGFQLWKPTFLDQLPCLIPTCRQTACKLLIPILVLKLFWFVLWKETGSIVDTKTDDVKPILRKNNIIVMVFPKVFICKILRRHRKLVFMLGETLLNCFRFGEAMALTKWICSKSTKQMFVKIVHPGGHVELHDGPVLAAEIMNRNPKCCVAHPNVFQQPWAILAPETTLMPGQKFYVVPKHTVRRLQSLALKHSPSMAREIQKLQSCKHEEENNEKVTSCLSFRKKDNDAQSSGDGCFTCMLTGIKIVGSTVDRSGETKSSMTNSASSSETKTLCRNKGMDSAAKTENTPNRLSSFDNWQPGLESISEE